MKEQFTREDALKLVTTSSKYEHSLRVSKMLKDLAIYLKEDEIEWELVGLLHDIDYDQTISNLGMHGVIAGEMLHEKLSHQAVNAIKSHDTRSGFEPKDKLANLLISVDALDNLLEILTTENSPSVELIENQLENWSLEKPWLKELILKCTEYGFSISEYLSICLESLK